MLAGSVAIGAGGTGAGALGGAGVYAENSIRVDVHAIIDGDTTDAGTPPAITAPSISVTATDAAVIWSIAGAVAIAAAFAGTGSAAISIGVAIALNEIDNSVLAAIDDAVATANGSGAAGTIQIAASETATIQSLTAAASLAAAASAFAGVAVSGAGAFASNVITTETVASADGSSLIANGAISVTATDTSTIQALIAALSAAVGAGAAGIAVSIGLSLARNVIGGTTTVVDADFRSNETVDLVGGSDPSTVRVTGGHVTADLQSNDGDGTSDADVYLVGGEIVRIVDDTTDGTPTGTSEGELYRYVGSPGDVDLDGTNFGSASLWKEVGGVAGAVYRWGGAATSGVDLNREDFGDTSRWTLVTADHTTADAEMTSGTLTSGDTVFIAGGPGAGDIYEYVGPTRTACTEATDSCAPINFRTEDYRDRSAWRLQNVDSGGASAAKVHATLTDTSVAAGGALTLTATATPTIQALVIAASAAVSGGAFGFGLSGAGAASINSIAIDVAATITGDGDPVDGDPVDDDDTDGEDPVAIRAASITMRATDNATIQAINGAASLAVALGATAVALSIAVAIAANTIENTVTAGVSGADDTIEATSGDLTIAAVENATIEAVSAAASFAVGCCGVTSVVISGAGAVAVNTILTKVNATIGSSDAVSAGKVDLDAEMRGSIRAVIVAASAAVAIGAVAVGASIGVSLAWNLIGTDFWGNDAPAEVRATIADSSVDAEGALTADATSSASIEAIVIAVAVAISGGAVGIGFSGAGSSAVNTISTVIEASIGDSDDDDTDGDGATGVIADSIALTALDSSRIDAITGAASVAAAFGFVGAALAVAVSYAQNTIDNVVKAAIIGADTLVDATGTGGITLSASQTGVINAITAAAAVALSGGAASVSVAGGGAVARNLIGSDVIATIASSNVDSGGIVSLSAVSSGAITAIVVAAAAAASLGLVGISAAIGVSVATNQIGGSKLSASDTYDYTSKQVLTAALGPGRKVVVLDGFGYGTVYKYIGTSSVSASSSDPLDLRKINYHDTLTWEVVGGTSEGAQVHATIVDSSIDADGALSLTATASGAISATVVAVAASLAAGFIGLAVAGAGSVAFNTIRHDVEASIAGDGARDSDDDGDADVGIRASSISLAATSTSTIEADVVAASLAFAIGAAVGASVAIAIAVAENTIASRVVAQTSGTDEQLRAKSGGISVIAGHQGAITATTAAASLAVAVGTGFAASIAGAGALASNVILATVLADVGGFELSSPAASEVHAATDVTVTATMSSTIEALVLAVAASASIGAAGLGASIGAAIARNLIGWEAPADPNDERDPATRTVADRALVQASVTDASIHALRALTLTAEVSGAITANVAAGAVAASGGLVGISLSGAGASTRNQIAVDVNAIIDGDGATGISADSVNLSATDTATITAFTGAAGIAVAIGVGGASAALSESLTKNDIMTSVVAAIRNADGDGDPDEDSDSEVDPDDVGVDADENGDGIGISISATNSATISATGTAASVAAAVGLVAAALATAGADVLNVIRTDTIAEIVGSNIDSEGDVLVSATDTATITATVAAESISVAGGVFAGAIAYGSSYARNFIGYAPAFTAFTADPATVKARVTGTWLRSRGDLEISATASQTVTSTVSTSSYGLAAGFSLAVGASTSMSFNYLAATVTAEIGAGSDVDVSGDVDVVADNTTIVRTSAVAASLAVAIGIASVAIGEVTNTNTIANIVSALVTSATVVAGGDVSVTADDEVTSIASGRTSTTSVSIIFASSDASAYVASTVDSTVSATGSSATIDAGGTIDFIAAGDIRSGDPDANLTIPGRQYDDATTAIATSKSGSLVAIAESGAVAIVNHRPTVSASLGGTVAADGAIKVEGVLDSYARAQTIAGSYGTVAVGGSVATVTITPTVSASTTGGTITSRDSAINVIARHNRNEDGSNSVDVLGRVLGASVEAQASSGGLIAASGAYSSAANSPNVSTSGTGTLAAAGGITFRTLSIAVARSVSEGSAGGLVGVGQTDPTAEASGTVGASFSGNVAVDDAGTTATDDDTSTTSLTVESDAIYSARARGESASGGLFSGTNDDAMATVRPTVSASLGAGSIDLTGNLTVDSFLLAEGDGVTKGTSVGGISVGSANSTVTVDPTVSTTIADGAVISAGGTITIGATAAPYSTSPTDYSISAIDTGNDTITVVNHGLLTGDVVEYDPNGNTAIDGDWPTTTVPGEDDTTITVNRQHNVINVYNADGSINADLLALGSVFDGDYTDDATYSDGDPTTTDPSKPPFGVDGDTETITFEAAHNFLTGDAVRYRPVDATVTVGGLNAGGLYYAVVIDDTTIKLVASASDADLAKYLQPISGVSSNQVTVSGSGFAPGTAVTYDAPDPFEFQSGQVDVTLELEGGDLTGLDDTPDGDNIVFLDEDGNRVAHHLETGDIILYRTDGADLAPLADGDYYRVIKVDDYQIQLKRTDDVPSLTVDFVRDANGASPRIVRSTGSWTSDGFTDGVEFVISDVAGDLNEGTYVVGSSTALTLYLDATTGAAVKATKVVGTMNVTAGVEDDGTFDRITRTTRTWTADGFAENQDIWVDGVARRIRAILGAGLVIELTERGVLGSTVSTVDRGGVSATFDSEVLGLDPDKDDQSTHSVIDVRDLPIAGLEDGHTYYVVGTGSSALTSFQLEDAAGNVITISGAVGSRTHYIGPQGIDITTSSGRHELRQDIDAGATLSGTTQQLLGPGAVPLGSLSPPAGDGVSSASSRGSSGGFVGSGRNSADVVVTMDVDVDIEADLITAGSDIVVFSVSHTSSSGSSRNGSGGAIAIGKVRTDLVTLNTSTVTLDDTRLIAGGDVTIDAIGTTTSVASGTANAGGGIGLAEAETTVVVSYDTLVQLIDASSVIAGGTAIVRATSGTEGKAKARGDGKGFGADGEADAFFYVGFEVDSSGEVQENSSGNLIVDDARTKVDIGTGSAVEATRTILRSAIEDICTRTGTSGCERTVNGFDVLASAKAYGAGFYGESNGHGTVDINSRAEIDVDGSARVTGVEGVDLITRYNDVDTHAYGFSRATGLFGHVDADATNRTDLDADITTSSASLITAGPREDDPADLADPDNVGMDRLALYIATTYGGSISGTRDAEVSRRALAGGGADETPDDAGDVVDEDRDVTLNGDVRILSGRSPRLIVSSDGQVTLQVEVTVIHNDDTNGIVLGDITNPGAGNVLVDTTDVNGSGGTWYFRDSLQYVLIRNESTRPIYIADIDVLNNSRQPEVDFTGKANSVMFDIRREVTPTLIIIESVNASSTANDVHLEGTIDNPIGTTSITVDGGALIADTTRDAPATTSGGLANHTSLVITNLLQIAADEQVGTANRINLDMVDGDGFPVATTFQAGRVSTVTDSIYLGVDNVFVTGQQVQYHEGSAEIVGLDDGAYYYVISDGERIQLTATPGGDIIELTPTGDSTVEHTLIPVNRAVISSGSGSVRLDLRGLRRKDRDGDNPHTVPIDVVDAGPDADDDIDILLRSSLLQTGVGTSGGVKIYYFDTLLSLVQSDGTFYTGFRTAGSAQNLEGAAFGTGTDLIHTVYDFRSLDTDGNRTLLGLIAGGDIVVEAALPDADVTTDARIDVIGITDTELDGHVDVLTNGTIEITEDAGDLQVGRVRSTQHDVTLWSPERILDWYDPSDTTASDFGADVEGVDITMTAGTEGVHGGIGLPTDFLEIDVDTLDANGTGTGRVGVLNATDTAATSTAGIFLTDIDEDLPVDLVDTTADVSLATTEGSIVDANDDGLVNVRGDTVDIRATGGSIGEGTHDLSSFDDLEIDSRYTSPTAGDDVGLWATDGIFLTELDGELRLVEAVAGTDLRLTVTESADLDEDLVLLATGAVRYAETGETTVTDGRIRTTSGWVWLRIGDDLVDVANTTISAGTWIDIFLDFGNLDTHYGVDTTLLGTITPGTSGTTDTTDVYGNVEDDRITLDNTTLGGRTWIFGGPDADASNGADGEDRFTIVELQTMDVAAGHHLVLDGQAGTDRYEIRTVGSKANVTAQRDYVIDVLDSGAPDDGVDLLDVYANDGTQNGELDDGTLPDDDIFLLRKTNAIAATALDRSGDQDAFDSDPDRPAFVAVLTGTLEQARASDPDGVVNVRPQEVQRINYDTALNGRLSVYGQGGNDFFAVDDNSAITNLDGGLGNDQFQIGQIFGAKRDVDEGSLESDDVFATVATTRGWLSRGISVALVAQGGDGDDQFTVYSNGAELRLEGDDDNDLFVVRAFALAETVDADGDGEGDGEEIVWLDEEARIAAPKIGVSTSAPMDIRTGGGDDEVSYNINAPVSVDGGSGFDKLVVLGTEFPDDFVITAEAIYGGGLNVRFARVEVIEVDGLEGDDEFFVLSTPFGVATRVIGGLGSDQINVGGDVTEDIIMREIEGVSGAVNHAVTSDDTAYDGLPVEGVDLQVAGETEGLVVITETDGFTSIGEGTSGVPVDTYTVHLSVKPTTTVYVTISAARSPENERPAGEDIVPSDGITGGGDTMWLSADGTTYTHTIWSAGDELTIPDRALVLVFTPDDYSTPQTVYVQAVDDDLAEGERVVTINHSVISADAGADPQFDHTTVRNVEVTIRDDDQPGIIVTEVEPGTSDEDRRNVVIEGNATTGLTDELLVELAVAPAAGTTVTVRLVLDDDEPDDGFDEIEITSADDRYDASTRTITFVADEDDWWDPVRLMVAALNDLVREDPRTSVITFEVDLDAVDADPDYLAASVFNLVEVLDDESAGVVVIESDGDTVVVGGTAPSSDDYDMRLTSAPTADVDIAILTDGLTDVGSIRGVDVTDADYADVGTERKGLFSGEVVFEDVDATPRVRRTDGGSFLADGFLEGQRVRLDGTRAGIYKIAQIRGDNDTKDETLQLTLEKGLWGTGGVAAEEVTITKVAIQVTFTTDDWWQLANVELDADGFYDKPANQENVKTFAAQPHLLNELLGPLAVEGGVTGADRSLKLGVKLPGEGDAPLFEIGPQPPESEQIDILNVFNDSSQMDRTATITATNLSGLGMARDLEFPADSTAHGEPNVFPGGISYGRIVYDPETETYSTDGAFTSIEVLNILLGSGNDEVTIESTLQPALEDDDDPSTGDVLPAYGVLTVLHAGGNSKVELSGTLFVDGDTIVRPDGRSWASVGFEVGQVVSLSGVEYEIVELTDDGGDGAGMILDAVVPTTAGDLTVEVIVTPGDPAITAAGDFTVVGPGIFRSDGVTWASEGFAVGQTVTTGGAEYEIIGFTSSGAGMVLDRPVSVVSRILAVAAVDPDGPDGVLVGGDLVTVTGGAGPDSPLVVYGDTSQDALWYSGDPEDVDGVVFEPQCEDAWADGCYFKFDAFPDDYDEDEFWYLATGNPYDYDGHDVIDASALFADLADDELPSVGFTAYGGNGDDLIIGSQAGDHLAGGSGDDTILGQRGIDHIYGDGGINVDILWRLLEVVATDESGPDAVNRDELAAGEDLIHGEGDGTVGTATYDTLTPFDDVIFGDHGLVTQQVVGVRDLSDLGPLLQRIQTTGFIREIATVEPTNGADDAIHGDDGRDRILGGNGDDTITGDDQANVVFGDHGRLVYTEGQPDGSVDVTILHLVESIATFFGGADTITTGPVDDIVVGGARGDTITTGVGASVVFGDHGRITGIEDQGPNRPIDTRTPVDDFQVPTFARIETINPAAGSTPGAGEHGGADTITTGVDRDIVFGGAMGDTIVTEAGETAEHPDGNNVVFGDYGFLSYVEDHNPSPISLDHVWTSDEAYGGNDTIRTGTRNDVVFGGFGADVIDADTGENIVFGDYGRVTGIEWDVFNRPIPSPYPEFVPDDYPVAVLQLVEGYAPAGGEFGGADTITTGIGRDMVFGGSAGDTIVANAAETAASPDGNNIVIGDYGFVDYLVDDVEPGDNPHDIDVISTFEDITHLGGADTITTGNANDIIIAGAGDDTIVAGQGKNLAFGDNVRISSDPTVIDRHETSFSVHEFIICIIETIGFGDDDGGDDTVYGSDENDILFGGTGDDVIYGYGGDDIIFGDQGRVTCAHDTPYDPDNPNGVCVDLGGPLFFVATNVTTNTGSGNDLVYAGAGDDIVMGQQGDDIIYGEDGDDLLIGGSNVAGALDGDDVIDGGAGDDAIAGDNAECCRRPDTLDPRMRALDGTVIYGTTLGTDDGHALVTVDAGNLYDPNMAKDPTGIAQYRVVLLDHSDEIEANRPDLWGDDHLAGGSGSDEIWGQLGDDVIQGDGQVDSDVDDLGVADWFVLEPYTHDLTAADPRPALLPDGPAGTRIGAWRSTDETVDETLVVHPSIERADDGDDYVEGNGGDDTVFGGLGQDDIVGDSSDLYLDGLLGQHLSITGTGIVQIDPWLVIGVSDDGSVLTVSGRPLDELVGAVTVTLDSTGESVALPGVVVEASPNGHAITLSAAGFDWRTLEVCTGSSCRPTGADLVFGGAGVDIGRNDEGDATFGADGSILTFPTGHARDADVIAGDNARVLRLVGVERRGLRGLPALRLRRLHRRAAGRRAAPDRPPGGRAARLHLRWAGLRRRVRGVRPRSRRRDPRRVGRRRGLRHDRQRRDLRRRPERRPRRRLRRRLDLRWHRRRRASWATTAGSPPAATARRAGARTARPPAWPTGPPATPSPSTGCSHCSPPTPTPAPRRATCSTRSSTPRDGSRSRPSTAPGSSTGRST